MSSARTAAASVWLAERSRSPQLRTCCPSSPVCSSVVSATFWLSTLAPPSTQCLVSSSQPKPCAVGWRVRLRTVPRHGNPQPAAAAHLRPRHDSARRRSTRLPLPKKPIRLGAVEVRPGEILVGDDDGIVVLSDTELDAAVEAAEAIQRREGRIRSAIQDGTSLFEQLNFAEHLENLQAGRPTSLAFTVE